MATDERLTLHEVVAGRFSLERESAGRHGAVFLARDVALHRSAAIKVLPSDPAGDATDSPFILLSFARPLPDHARTDGMP